MKLRHLHENDATDDNLVDILLSVATACIEIAEQLSVQSITEIQRIHQRNVEKGGGAADLGSATTMNVQGEIQKPMDIIANEIFIRHIKDKVSYIVSEEEETIIVGDKPSTTRDSCSGHRGDQTTPTSHGATKSYEIAFDPLDGSSNLDINIATGSIFGIFSRENNDMNDDDKSDTDEGEPFSKTGRESIVASGYCLYSSSWSLYYV